MTLWDVDARERIATDPALPHASHVDFSPDRALVVAKNTLGDVVVLDGATLEERARIPGRPHGEGADIRFSGDGDLLIDGSWKGRLLVRDRLNGEIVWEESVADARITTLTCTRDRRIWAYTRETGKSVAILKREWPFWKHHAATVTAARNVKAPTVTDDGRRLAAKTATSLLTFEFGLDSHPARLLTAANDLPISGTHDAVAWSPDGRSIANAGHKLAQVFNESLEQIYAEPMPYPSDVDFSPAGTLLALGDWSQGLVTAWPPHR